MFLHIWEVSGRNSISYVYNNIQFEEQSYLEKEERGGVVLIKLIFDKTTVFNYNFKLWTKIFQFVFAEGSLYLEWKLKVI